MQVADCLITKAGPGTIAEAAVRGLPTMLSSFLPGQEAGNVPFVVNHGMHSTHYNRGLRRQGPLRAGSTHDALFVLQHVSARPTLI